MARSKCSVQSRTTAKRKVPARRNRSKSVPEDGKLESSWTANVADTVGGVSASTPHGQAEAGWPTL